MCALGKMKIYTILHKSNTCVLLLFNTSAFVNTIAEHKCNKIDKWMQSFYVKINIQIPGFSRGIERIEKVLNSKIGFPDLKKY